MSYEAALKVAAIVHDAGGRIVGRTRLQKIAYLLSVAGYEKGLPFVYKHYGPYSEEVAVGARDADLLGLLKEVEQSTSWGGVYSTFTIRNKDSLPTNPARYEWASLAAAADAIELELAATAVFLAKEGHKDPWGETARRKPEKAEGRLEKAKELYRRLSTIGTPVKLPLISS